MLRTRSVPQHPALLRYGLTLQSASLARAFFGRRETPAAGRVVAFVVGGDSAVADTQMPEHRADSAEAPGAVTAGDDFFSEHRVTVGCGGLCVKGLWACCTTPCTLHSGYAGDSL